MAYEPLVHTNGVIYAADKNDKYVPIEIEDLRFFGYPADDVLAVQQGKKEIYFAVDGNYNIRTWKSMLANIEGYSATISGKAQTALTTSKVSGSVLINSDVIDALKKAGVKTVTGKFTKAQKM